MSFIFTFLLPTASGILFSLVDRALQSSQTGFDGIISKAGIGIVVQCNNTHLSCESLGLTPRTTKKLKTTFYKIADQFKVDLRKLLTEIRRE